MPDKLYIPRKDWHGQGVARDRIAVPTRNIYVHHTVTTEPGPKADYKADRAHAEYTFNLHDEANGAYSFLFFPSGRVFEFAGFGFEGAHTYDHNGDGHGFCFAGNYMTDRPTDAALESFLAMVRLGVRRGAVKNTEKNPVNLIPHRAVGAGGAGPGSTACPGTHIIEELPRLARELKHDRR